MRLIDADVALQRFIKETETSGKNAIHINTIKRLLQDVECGKIYTKVPYICHKCGARLLEDRN